MSERIDFLNQIWIEERDYYVVQAVNEKNRECAYYVVFAGEHLNSLPEFDGGDSVFVGWYDRNSGEEFNSDNPIMEDMQICAKFVDSPAKRVKRVIKLVPIVIITVIFIVLVTIELKRLPPTRMKKDG